MKFYNSVGPNPHVVRMFAAEKGIELPKVEVDLLKGDNRKPPYLDKNPSGQMPALELDDGTVIAEITAICEYLDEVGKGRSLIGGDAKARAVTRMWTRRVDLNICEPMANGFRFSEGLALFKNRITTIPAAAEGLKQVAREKLTWLNGLMDGRPFLTGTDITLADVLLYCFLAFGKQIGQPYDPNLANLHAWYQRVSERPSAKA